MRKEREGCGGGVDWMSAALPCPSLASSEVSPSSPILSIFTADQHSYTQELMRLSQHPRVEEMAGIYSKYYFVSYLVRFSGFGVPYLGFKS